MKKQSNTLFTKIGKDAFADLAKEVKETIAFDLVEPRPGFLQQAIYGTSIARQKAGRQEDIYKQQLLSLKNYQS